MKNNWNKFFNLSQREKMGLLAFTLFLVCIWGIYIWMAFNEPKFNNEAEKKLQLAWQAEQNKIAPEASLAIRDHLFEFDPNTIDSFGLLRLGLSNKTIRYLINWRNKGKHFYKKEDLKPLYSLSESDYQRLEPYIKIENKQLAATASFQPQFEKHTEPQWLDLNSCDSANLLRIKGIGNILAHKIIERRIALGGFINHEQLLEIYKFPDSTFLHLKEKLRINKQNIHKIELNTCSESQLARHPYVGAEMAKNIIKWREGLNKYENIGQLRQVPLMNEEKYRKIAAYCTID